MIDLSLTRELMLADIRASEFAPECELSDSANPEFAAALSLRFQTEKRTRSEMYGALCSGLAARYASVLPERLIRDVTRPLKKALGNAYKRGNRGDPEKNIALDIVFTPAGAVMAVTDEGEGFDVDTVYGGFRDGRVYFDHHGDGFACFERAGSAISYADGGRTFLLCFRPGEDRNSHPTLGLAADEDYMMSVLAGELSRFKKMKAELEACRIFAPAAPRFEEPELRYLLQYSKRGGKSEKSEVLTARLLSEEAARADFENAHQLYEGPFKSAKGVAIPKPQNAFKQHPRLVFYSFDPTRDLFDYLESAPEEKRVAKVAAKVAAGLRTLHHSGVEFEGVERCEDLKARERERLARVASALDGASGDAADSVREFLARVGEDIDALAPYAPLPIHGAFGMECVRSQGEDLFFYRFEHCRRSHPGLDLGAFLADLALLASRGETLKEVARAAKDAFYGAYFGAAGHPGEEAAAAFVGIALLARIERHLDTPREEWLAHVQRMISAV